MRRKIKRTFLGLLILGMAIMIPYFIFKTNTKSFSPEDTVTFHQDDLTLEVFYNRPYKKGRELFGSLVPYGEVWRTGANEATTFYTSKDILVDGSFLPAGIYTLWTIPNEHSWEIILNSEMYPWGITAAGTPSRVPKYDVLKVEVPTKELEESLEQFTISFTTSHGFILLNLAWDQLLVSVPIRDASDVESPAIMGSDHLQ